MSFLPNSAMDSSSGMDPEMRRFMEVEAHKARFQNNVHTFTDLCWDRCVDKVTSTSNSRAEQQCIVNCVERFIDTTNFVVNKLGNLKQ